MASLQESLRSQYDALFPALCEAIPGLFPADVYTWENFEWMAGLWVRDGGGGGGLGGLWMNGVVVIGRGEG